MAEARALALVTGASSGIGFELVKLFAEDGYDLIVAGDDDGIDASVDKLAASGVDVPLASRFAQARRSRTVCIAAPPRTAVASTRRRSTPAWDGPGGSSTGSRP